jgi:hypothetical protein
LRASCFHSATHVQHHRGERGALHHLDQARLLKLVSSVAKPCPRRTMPSSSMTYISATTRGRVSSLGQIGGQRKSGGLRGLHAGADEQEGKAGSQLADPGQAQLALAGEQEQAKGMIARPPNCSRVPIQM